VVFVVAGFAAAGLVTFAFVLAFVLASGFGSVAAWRAEARVGAAAGAEAAAPFFAGAISVVSVSLGVFLMYLTPATVL